MTHVMADLAVSNVIDGGGSAGLRATAAGGAAALAAAALRLKEFTAEGRGKSDCHFRKTATEYDRKPGIKWLSCTVK